jgi:uncharacterized membrane protein
MEMAEAERIRYLQGPEGAEKIPTGLDTEDPKEKLKLFEKLLPYAMLFGIEKKWAKQFEGLYTQPPEWFHGNNLNSFSTGYLIGSLGSIKSASSAVFTSPQSSGSSGFGGGGFSGGGGGGGGGGGW